jgi:hypothetical protein
MATTDQLRNDIDSGRTNDKVAARDPAAAPLGADDEAAGTPPSQEAIAMARSHEISKEPDQEPVGGLFVYLGALAVVSLSLVCGSLFFGHVMR